MQNRIIFHIDVNSAYLSWEAVYRLQKGDPTDLRTIPSVVGGDPKSRHGIVLAKSISAKKYKIQTGESLYSALQKCPNLVIVPPHYDLYVKCSNAMVSLLKEYSPSIQRFSVDECFIDFTNMEPHFGDPIDTAYKIKNRIKHELGFTVSIGVSSNKLLAKMGSDLKKPDAVTTVFPPEIEEKMWSLPVEDLFMVGRATSKKLRSLGINSIGDLATTNIDFIKSHLKSHGVLVWNYANGIENSTVRSNNRQVIKGIGNSTTTAFDVSSRHEAHMVLLSLTETVCMRLRDARCCAQLVSIGVKTKAFRYSSHQHKFQTPTDITTQVFNHAKKIFDDIWNGEYIRHLGVRVSDLCSNEFYQINLLDTELSEKQRAVDKTIDKIRMKYGSKDVIRGCFLHSGINPLQGGVGEDDYPLMSSLL